MDDQARTSGQSECFNAILARRLSRRDVLSLSAATSALLLQSPSARAEGGMLNFVPVGATRVDSCVISPGYRATVLFRWGDAVLAGAPGFDPLRQSASAQATQFGVNNDFIGYFPLPYGSRSSTRGLLYVNHEFTAPELMFPNYVSGAPTRDQVDIELQALGGSVVEIEAGAGGWKHVSQSLYNRRVTGMTPMRITGQATGHPWLITSDDPTGTQVYGTIFNCSGGTTPWGTVLTCEEGVGSYFSNLNQLSNSDPRKAHHQNFGISGGSGRGWHHQYGRFDAAAEPNEAFRFGWIVEVDPFDPTSIPNKRTSLGRMRHESATTTVSVNNRIAVYLGDDQAFECAYKFVPDAPFDPTDRTANLNTLDTGTLYAARFNDDGTGTWLPLVFGTGPLTPGNGFESQADVLIKTRLAAAAVGATRMDRVEDFEHNPVNGKVYVVCTNNSGRTADGATGVNAANPRANNVWGHIIEIEESNEDSAATTFTWSIFLLCGPRSDPSTYFAGYSKERVSSIACPDNITFDAEGNLWIATDGMAGVVGFAENEGLFAVPVVGPDRGFVRKFASLPVGSECTGPCFTPDNKSLFLSVQHPGSGGTFERPISTWPDGAGTLPRPAVVVIQAINGSTIGMATPSLYFVPEAPR